MGIAVEFNPDLALRDIAEYKAGRRKIEECVPENMMKDEIYSFLKKGQRLYYLSDSEFYGGGQIPLCKTSGKEELSDPIASIKIIETTHFLDAGEVWTKGKYKVVDVFKADEIHFNWMKRI